MAEALVLWATYMFRCRFLRDVLIVGAAAAATAFADPMPPAGGNAVHEQSAQPLNQPGKRMNDVTPSPLASSSDIPESASYGLGGYLAYMSSKLNLRFTIEDRPDADGIIPWVENIDDFERDFELGTIDALVAHLNEEVDAVTFVRSTKVLSVVHVIAESLQIDGYAMDHTVTFSDYDGRLCDLPTRIGSLVDDKVGVPDGGAIPVGTFGDRKTRVQVDAENEVVRDVLTKAAPLENYSRFLWYATADDGASTVVVEYGGPKEVEEESNAVPTDSSGK